jgi:hypothetical protein
LTSKATQGEAYTAVEEDRKRATMVGNDSVSIFKERGGEWEPEGGGKKYETTRLFLDLEATRNRTCPYIQQLERIGIG